MGATVCWGNIERTVCDVDYVRVDTCARGNKVY